MSRLWREPAPLMLASRSTIRSEILEKAGVPVEIRPSGVDERAVEAALPPGEQDPAGVARALSAAKALAVSAVAPGRLVLGCDQTLDLDGERFTKPESLADGRAQLFRLAGRTHRLTSGAALARDGAVLWSAVDEARLTIRPLSERFVEAYLAEAGEATLSSVGGYQFEGLGAQLFESVEGDFRTVLGLPLTPLLGGLRSLGAVLA